ncbi:MAG: DUF732 domain-containing protein [Mycobacterium sp.]
MKRRVPAFALCLLIGAGAAGAILATAAPSAADNVGYLVNVTVKPGYNFANADQALSYGYGLCDQIAAGAPYPVMAEHIRTDFATTDDHLVSYLLSQAAEELCPAQIWQLRRSVTF